MWASERPASATFEWTKTGENEDMNDERAGIELKNSQVAEGGRGVERAHQGSDNPALCVVALVLILSVRLSILR